MTPHFPSLPACTHTLVRLQTYFGEGSNAENHQEDAMREEACSSSRRVRKKIANSCTGKRQKRKLYLK